MTWISCFCRQHIDLLLSFEHGLLQRVVAKYISKHHDKLVRERRTESGERRRKDDDVRGCFLICPHVQTRLSIVTAASPGVVQTPIISLVFFLIDYSLFFIVAIWKRSRWWWWWGWRRGEGEKRTRRMEKAAENEGKQWLSTDYFLLFLFLAWLQQWRRRRPTAAASSSS